MSNLVIVESPAKANTIRGYLGSSYKVTASKGHVRDLPKSKLGVDIEDGFKAHYINIRGKGDLINQLKKEAKSCDKVFLATDPDREGEAISWHLATALGIPPEKALRVSFNEITKTAVKSAIKDPHPINMDLVNSQQTRRILDRIVGYKASPFLWKNLRSGLSAGRVQSVATRIIVEREEEIKNFVPSEYWTVTATLLSGKSHVKAIFYGRKDEKIELHSKEETDEVLSKVEKGEFKVTSVKNAAKTRNPAPPFTTSTLQQEAAHKLGFNSSRIMKIAQELYEGVNLGSGVHGLITYMRTDSLRISVEAANAAESYIKEAYGEEYYPKTRRFYKAKSNAQDAHEAIRPSSMANEPEKIKGHLTSEQYKLYKLIWDRFVASQMASARLATSQSEIENSGYTFHTSSYAVEFPGFLTVYDPGEYGDLKESEKQKNLVTLTEGETLKARSVDGEQHFTEPAPRFTEASLIRFLEEKGIGRPSTYTPIITTILSRDYVKREGKSLKPTYLGEVTTKLMKDNFPDIVDYKFTANMEDKLDEIENGEANMTDVLSDFYAKFSADLAKAEEASKRGEIEIPQETTDYTCENCGSKLIIKNGRYGRFAACPNYPTCRFTLPLDANGNPKKKTPAEKKEPEKTGIKCEICGGEMVVRTGRFGSFYACSNYPSCRNTKQITKPIGVKCPLCGSEIVAKTGGKKRVTFYSCEKYPECSFSTWDRPTDVKCPKCGKMTVYKKSTKTYKCIDPACGETFAAETEEKDS